MTTTVNGGFWDLPAAARAAAEEAARVRYGAVDFFDLDPRQRAAVYEDATRTYWNGPQPGPEVTTHG